MYTKRFFFTLLLSSLLLTGVNVSAQTLHERLASCSEESDKDIRLACFDLLVQEQTIARDTTEEEHQKINHEPVNETSANTNKGMDQFGRSNKSAPALIDGELMATVLSAEFSGRNTVTFILNNGQVWKGKSKKKKFVPSDNDNIRITSGVLGVFYMNKVGSKKRIRVKRIVQ